MKMKFVTTAVLSLGMIAMTGSAFAQYGPPQGPPPPPPPGYAPQGQGWNVPPGEYQEIQRQGFHAGVEGARHDFDNHRPPNVNNRDEYRHPQVPPELRHDYREAFRRGYQLGVQHIYGGGGYGPR